MGCEQAATVFWNQLKNIGLTVRQVRYEGKQGALPLEGNPDS